MNRYWTLADGPVPNWPQADTFVLNEGEIPTPGPGQALSRTIYVSLDPYQWGYKKRRTEPAGLALPCAHGLAGDREPDAGFAAGDLVFNTNGWTEYAPDGRGGLAAGLHDPAQARPGAGAHLAGGGRAGHAGADRLRRHGPDGDPKPGETVVVSAASGGVGQIAGQLAEQRGARVVGIAGREAKCRFVVDELGYDACVSHLSPTLPADLAAACPAGIDVYFENVGGEVFEAVLPLFNPGARMTICGLIAHYGDDEGTDSRATLMARRRAGDQGARRDREEPLRRRLRGGPPRRDAGLRRAARESRKDQVSRGHTPGS